MRSFRKLMVVCGALLACSAAFGAEPGALQTANELLASAIKLPATAPGVVQVVGCETCATRVFRISADTLFRVGDELVSFAAMRAELASRPNELTLFELAQNGADVYRISIAPRPL